MNLRNGSSSLASDSSSWYKGDLVTRIFFTIFLLVVYRLGTYIPIPGINPQLLSNFIATNSSGMIGMFNLFSGGALGRMTIFALNVMPYIMSSIVIQILSITTVRLKEISQDGELGRAKINSYVRYMTVVLCIIHGTVMLMGLEKMSDQVAILVVKPDFMFILVGIMSLLGGTMFLIWLGEMITANGVGNGISLIIFTGIMAELPSSISSIVVSGHSSKMTVLIISFFMIIFCLLLLLVIFVEKSLRKIPVHYPKRQVKNKLYNGSSTYMPLKINISGVIPSIFSNAILLFPVTIASFHKGSYLADFILKNFSSGKILYIFMYFISIIFFTFFYSGFIFNSDDTADSLKRNGGFIPGKRPGKNTAEYLRHVMKRMTVISAIYLVAICIVPEMLRYKFDLSIALGGTSLLIVVTVLIDTFSQIQSHLYQSQYSKLIKKSGFLRKK